ncbi:replicative DNA helicase [Desulfobotulus sp.]|jgi:replicative DNA helicase|uniref:replicative DNA helicase n=1 Tax=Desulfobotulus sp. TaxID=1940337 RepID=UPI002A35A9BC|nr:replicative DNA helicase [Desulfobotulus sp.]MDY0162678.1 replicative DNA helicase [Desulfobotulus sp.]
MADTTPSDKDPLFSRTPPHSPEAETSLLSAILIHNDVLLDIVDILDPEHFYRTSHQKIYAAARSLFAKGQPVDLVTVANFLQDSGHLESVGGAAALARIVDTAPIAPNAVEYAKIVRSKASLRRLIERATQIVGKCFSEAGDVDAVIDFAQSVIFEIAENKTRKAFSPLQALIDVNIDTIEQQQGSQKDITGIPTGYRRLDQLTAGLQGSDLIILAARPAMGKTSFVLNMARNAAVESGVPVGIFSLEMSKEQLSMRLLTAEARVESGKVRGGALSPEEWNRINTAASILYEAPIFIDDSPDASPMEIRAKARRLKMEKGLGLLIIDYLQLMRGSSQADRRDLEIAEISRSLKGLAKELGIPVIALSQLNRMLEQRADKRPMLSDLRESGSLEQDADIVMFIYRDEVYNKDENNPNRGKAEIILAKHRNGPVGTAHMAFLGSYTRFEDLAAGEYPH